MQVNSLTSAVVSLPLGRFVVGGAPSLNLYEMKGAPVGGRIDRLRRRQRLQEPALSAAIGIATAAARVAGAVVGGDDTDVQVGERPRGREIFEHLEEVAEARAQLELHRIHRARVVDHEQHVDLVLEILLNANVGLLRHGGARRRHRRPEAGAQRNERERSDGTNELPIA
jgi:hypothetical protein